MAKAKPKFRIHEEMLVPTDEAIVKRLQKGGQVKPRDRKNKTLRPGQTSTLIPEGSVGWLLDRGFIEPDNEATLQWCLDRAAGKDADERMRSGCLRLGAEGSRPVREWALERCASDEDLHEWCLELADADPDMYLLCAQHGLVEEPVVVAETSEEPVEPEPASDSEPEVAEESAEDPEADEAGEPDETPDDNDEEAAEPEPAGEPEAEPDDQDEEEESDV